MIGWGAAILLVLLGLAVTLVSQRRYLSWLCLILLLVLAAFIPFGGQPKGIKVGSKEFTESVILGELLTQLARSGGGDATHVDELGGTSQLFQSLQVGDINIYTDYSGTIQLELLSKEKPEAWNEAQEILAKRGVLLSQPLGFNNGYAIGMLRKRAKQLGITRVSDLARHPELKFGFTNEFVQRADCWPGLRTQYGLPQNNVRGMNHDIAYRELKLGDVDAIDVYTTDAKIEVLDILILTDDLGYFRDYQAVLVYRDDLPERYPKQFQRMQSLQGRLDEQVMMDLNFQVDYDQRSEPLVAAEFLNRTFNIKSVVQVELWYQRVWKHTLEHLDLVRKSLIPAIFVGILLGVVAYKWRGLGQAILAIAGIVQTIPALALLVLLLPIMNRVKIGEASTGVVTAYVALFLYSLLPIIRNTFTGLTNIDPRYLDSADALGLPRIIRLEKIEFPLAMRSIIGGIKIAAILNIGFATLGALIGAGGYGEPVLTGIRRFDTGEILLGAVPAAMMALACQLLFELIERLAVPKGLRIRASQ